MHDGMQCDPIQGRGQGYKLFQVGNPAISEAIFFRHLQWELATEQTMVS